jgi:hypothetical protein
MLPPPPLSYGNARRSGRLQPKLDHERPLLPWSGLFAVCLREWLFLCRLPPGKGVVSYNPPGSRFAIAGCLGVNRGSPFSHGGKDRLALFLLAVRAIASSCCNGTGKYVPDCVQFFAHISLLHMGRLYLYTPPGSRFDIAGYLQRF